MGAFPADRRIVSERLTEMVGYRAGLAITEADILACLERHGYAFLYPPPETGIRMRSEAFEIMNRCVADSFVQPGALRALRTTRVLLHDRLRDENLVWQTLGFIDAALASAPQQELQSLETLRYRGANLLVTSLDVPAPETRALLRDTARRLHGDVLADAVDMAFREQAFRDSSSPWKRWVRSVEWSDVLDLADLFTSDSVTASYGRFFDQRFVTYLAGQYEDLAAVHWRKFEALVAEYFHRAGFEVKLGPGRNDNGVDIRIWEAGTTGPERQPPLVIVQCGSVARSARWWSRRWPPMSPGRRHARACSWPPSTGHPAPGKWSARAVTRSRR
jgi:restriction system protein